MTGQELRQLRNQLRLTQLDLAEQLGVHKITVSKWETGVHKVPEAVAKLLPLLVKDTQNRRTR